jgi:hypothetical protein
MATKNPTLGDYDTSDEPEMCPHDKRALDEDEFYCFECWMAQKEGTSYTMERDH